MLAFETEPREYIHTNPKSDFKCPFDHSICKITSSEAYRRHDERFLRSNEKCAQTDIGRRRWHSPKINVDFSVCRSARARVQVVYLFSFCSMSPFHVVLAAGCLMCPFGAYCSYSLYWFHVVSSKSRLLSDAVLWSVLHKYKHLSVKCISQIQINHLVALCNVVMQNIKYLRFLSRRHYRQ